MLPAMRTTLILNDDLVAKAKERALQQGTTMSEIANRALQDYLREDCDDAAGPPKRRIRLPSYRGRGPLVDLPPARIAALRDLDP